MSFKVKRLGLVCVALCLLAACSEAKPTATPDPVTISFVYPVEDFDESYLKAQVHEFNKLYTGVTVDLRPNGWYGDFDTFVITEQWIMQAQNQENIRDLQPFVAQDGSFDLDDFYPGAVELFSAGGSLWAAPAGMDMLVMFYNRDLFDRYGVPYPEIGWTWDDFLALALALRDPDAAIYGYAPSEDNMDALVFVAQHGGRLFDTEQGLATFDEPLNVEALEWYSELINRHNVAPSPQQAYGDFGVGSRDPYIGVISGQVGMWIGAFSDQGGDVYAQWNFNWGIATLPRDQQQAAQSWGWGYAMTQQTQHPEESWQWISFLSQRMPDRLIPVRRSQAESDEFQQRMGANASAVARASLESATLMSIQELLAPEGAELDMQILLRALGKVARGEATPYEALSLAQEQAED
jgi:multiple sugar transport system substrate-binding protein